MVISQKIAIILYEVTRDSNEEFNWVCRSLKA